MLIGLALYLRHRGRESHPPEPDRHAFIGGTATVLRALEPEGKVFFNSTYWSAVADTPIPKDAKVRVIGVDGLTLRVEPIEPSASDTNSN
jgi:membrane protein implicated in regulation of membrane protease activity